MLSSLMQPSTGSHESFVQRLLSLQSIGAPLTHAPATHTSPKVQTLPSLQGTVLLTCWQPLAGLQESSVQTFPSLQLAVMSVWTQPLDGLQESAVQRLRSSQSGG